MQIDQFAPGKVVVDGTSYDQDLILYAGTVINWYRVDFNTVNDADLQFLIAENVKHFLVGIGPKGHEAEVPAMTRFSFARGPIKIEFLPGEEAVARFNAAKGEMPMMLKVRTEKPFSI